MKYVLTFLLAYSSSFFASFAPDTLIKTLDGFCQIQDLQINDQLLSFDNKNLTRDVVSNTGTTTADNSVQIDLQGASIVSSYNQYFYLAKTSNWLRASDLKPGDYLLTIDNVRLPILGVRYLVSSHKFYDLTVQSNHNFFVSRLGILVHNEPITLGLLAAAGGTKAAIIAGYALKIAATGLIVFCCQKLSKSNRPANQIFPSFTAQSKLTDKVPAPKNEVQPNNSINNSGTGGRDPKKDDDEWNKKTPKELNKLIDDTAEKLGYKLTKDYPFYSHGEKVFKKGNKYISFDNKSHKGGFWKVFNIKGQRIATMSIDLVKVIGK